MSDKLQVSIYRINADETSESLDALAASKSFIKQSLTNSTFQGFELNLFYQKKASSPKWKGFTDGLAHIGQPVTEKFKSASEAFVMFLSKNSNRYAITGGHGHFLIQDCIDKDFGIEVLSRLMKKEDKVLRSTKEKSLTGGVLGTTKFFRKSLNLFDNDSFGKFYQELKASLDKDVLISKLGFTAEDIDKDLLCVAKSSFRVHKEMSLGQLINLIDGCEVILSTLQPIDINSVEKLVKKRDELLIKELERELLKQLWGRFSKDQDSVDFDLCADEFDKYLTADHYEISRGSDYKNCFGSHQFQKLTVLDDLFEYLRSSKICPNDQIAFDKLARNFTISSFDIDGVRLTEGKLIDHLLGDVVYNQKRYFLIDSSWYLIKDTFVSGLNDHCNSFVSKHLISVTENWPATLNLENDYNRLYLGKPNTVVLDRITPENIEPCDFFWWDDTNIYLCHVKAGFKNTMRDLCSQVSIAANRIGQDKASDKQYIRKIYIDLKSKIGGNDYFDSIGNQTNSITEDQFVELFASRTLVFVLALLDTAAQQRDIRKMQDFNSNIAKFSLQELSKEMRMLDVDFRIA